MRLILHIGTGKTGSTSIQRSLSANRDKLLKAGILYPQLARRIDHNPLAIATNPTVPREFKRLCEREGREPLATRFWEEAAASVRDKPGDTLVISSEYFSAGVDIGRLQALLQQYFPKVTSIQTICYLRPPASEYLSRLQQDLKASSLVSPLSRGSSYAPRLEGYKQIGEILLRLYERSLLKNGDVIADFLSFLPGKLNEETFTSLPEANTSISAEGMAVLQQFRMHVFPDDDNQFMDKSDRLLKLIEQSEAALGEGALSRPRLQSHIMAHLSKVTIDIATLRDRFGLDLLANVPVRGTGDETLETLPKSFDRDLGAVLIWDETRKAILVSKLLESLL